MKHIKLRTLVIILIGIDLSSKYLFYTLRYLDDSTVILPVFNTGISWSLPVPLIVTIIISVLGIGAFLRLFIKRKISRIITAFLIAGTAGNLIDRILYGGVRDFIDIGLRNFPVFNGADVLLCIGVGIRIMRVTLEKKR